MENEARIGKSDNQIWNLWRSCIVDEYASSRMVPTPRMASMTALEGNIRNFMTWLTYLRGIDGSSLRFGLFSVHASQVRSSPMIGDGMNWRDRR